MPFCSKCGFQVDSDDRFCTRCGAAIKYIGAEESDGSRHAQELPEKHAEWIRNPKSKKSAWSIFMDSMKHTFFDNDEEIPKRRKVINTIIIIAILAVGLSILVPYLDSVKISFGGPGNEDANGNCRYRLDARGIEVTDARFFKENMTMEMLVTNSMENDAVIETLAKTYEFRFDNRGDTDTEEISMLIPAGKTLRLNFPVRQDPYIIGLEFSGCEKLKVSEWETVN